MLTDERQILLKGHQLILQAFDWDGFDHLTGQLDNKVLIDSIDLIIQQNRGAGVDLINVEAFG